jgi:hypothetical protein
MLQVLFTAHDGGTAWRHALAPGEACAGWECVGPLGFAKRLGRLLGVPAETAATPDSLAAFTARLDLDDDGKRAYSESRRNDPFGVAAFLLALRDRLWLAGWSGASSTAASGSGICRASRPARSHCRPGSPTPSPA